MAARVVANMRQGLLALASLHFICLAGCGTSAGSRDGPPPADTVESTTFDGTCDGLLPTDSLGIPDAGPAVDASQADASLLPDARPGPDAFLAPTAEHLGTPCTSPTDCPWPGYFCLGLDSTTGAGYCSFFCEMNQDQQCKVNFPANEGVAGCMWQVAQEGGDTAYACGIECGVRCGTDYGRSCPAGLTCQTECCCSIGTSDVQCVPSPILLCPRGDFCLPTP
jgi:hypothetical protein